MSKSVEQILKKAAKYAKNGDLDSAREQYQNILLEYPGNEAAKKALKNLDIGKQHNLKINVDPKVHSRAAKHKALVASATQHYMNGALNKAESEYENLLKEFPNCEISLCNLGLIKKSKGDLDSAEKLMNLAISANNKFVLAFHNLAEILNLKRDYQAARQNYLRAIELDPKFKLSLISLCRLYLRQNMPIDAEKLATSALKFHGNEAIFHDLLGTSLKRQRNFKSALKNHQKAVELDSSSAAFLINLGNCYARLGEKEKPVSCFTKAIEIDPKFPDGYIHLAFHFQAQFKQMGLDKAEEVLQSALDRGLKSAKIYEQLARIYLKKGDLNRAFNTGKIAIEHNANSAESWITLSEISRKAGSLKEALDYARNGIKLQPGSAVAQMNLATVCIQAQKFKEALSPLDHCLNNPFVKHAEALAFKTIALREIGEHGLANEITDHNEFIFESELGIPDGFVSVEEFNDALEHEIKTHPSLEKSPLGFAARNSFLTNDMQTPLFRKFEALLRNKVKEYIASLPENRKHTFISDAPRDYFMRIWGTLSDNDGYIASHIHREGWISAAYYVKLPESVNSSDNEGWIEFGSPPEEFDLNADYPTLRIKPELGKIVIFPSFYYHRTLPYTSSDERMSISFDLQALK